MPSTGYQIYLDKSLVKELKHHSDFMITACVVGISYILPYLAFYVVDLEGCSVYKFNGLQLSGDVELHPSPYKINNSVQGNFNQGNVDSF